MESVARISHLQPKTGRLAMRIIQRGSRAFDDHETWIRTYRLLRRELLLAFE